jgi:hypothetical protein
VGEGSDAARAQVLAARGALADELERLEASARTAVDVPAKVRRNPGKAVGLAAGAGFLLVGGPKRVFRRAKRAVLGPPEPLPTSMLPKEIDKAIRELGDDGEKVRGTIEREFASYLEQTAPQRKKRDVGTVGTILALTVIRRLFERYGQQLVDQLFSTDRAEFEEQLARIRSRANGEPAPAAPEPAAPGDAPRT